MGYTHFWRQYRPFTAQEWATITAEAKRIVAKAMRGYYAGPETAESAKQAPTYEGIFGTEGKEGFAEKGAWRTFALPEIATPEQGKPIALCGPMGTGAPEFRSGYIALNGSEAKKEDYETFRLERDPTLDDTGERGKESFAFCKTEYRPYDPVVVSILAVAQPVAPDAIKVTSDGGPEAIRLLF